MEDFTRRLWEQQDRHPGDRHRLFQAASQARPARRVLYPGSFVDIAASFVFNSVTYIDVDRRAARFFADESGVREIIGRHRRTAPDTVRFIPADYATSLDLPDASFDLLISLYAGFVSEACTRYLRVGGHLLANPSHGDVAMASIDPRYELAAVVTSRSGTYRVDERDLDAYLLPKRPVEVTVESLHAAGRGVAYTRSAFAYLFRRTA